MDERSMDDMNGLVALVREVRDAQIRLESTVQNAADHGQRIGAIELQQARNDGSIRVLLWLVPGGPALVTLIAGIAFWATKG